MRVWISRDDGKFDGVLSFWDRKAKQNCSGDFISEEDGNNCELELCEIVGLKNGQCAEFEIRRVKKKVGNK